MRTSIQTTSTRIHTPTSRCGKGERTSKEAKYHFDGACSRQLCTCNAETVGSRVSGIALFTHILVTSAHIRTSLTARKTSFREF